MTDYKAIKLIKNGEEYCFGGGGGGARTIDLLVVGGGGGGPVIGGGGGGGGVIYCTNYELSDLSYSIVIGAGGLPSDNFQYSGCNGGNSCFGELIAYGGGGGGSGYYCGCAGCPGGSGGGAGMGDSGRGLLDGGCPTRELGNIIAQGGQGGATTVTCTSCALPGAGGGGAGGNGGSVMSGCQCGGRGGDGIQLGISGTNTYYGAGGGGSGCYRCGYPVNVCGGLGGTGGGGNGGRYACPNCNNCRSAGCNGTGYGAGGGGGGYSTSYPGGNGYQGIVIVRYPTDGSSGIKCATGGCCYTCGDYTIHCFTSNGTFCIVS